MMAGAAIGGAIGGVFAPIAGHAVGAIIGGIAGAISGRAASNGVKEAPLKAAFEKFETVRAEAEQNRKHTRLALQNELKSFVTQEQDKLRDVFKTEKIAARVLTDQMSEHIISSKMEVIARFKSLLDELRRDVHVKLCEFQKEKKSRPIREWLFPRNGDVAVIYARRWVSKADRRLKFGIDQLARMSADQSFEGIQRTLKFVVEFTQRHEFERPDFFEFVGRSNADVDRNVKIFDEEKRRTQERLLSDAQASQRRINAMIDVATVKFYEECRKWSIATRELYDTAQREVRKLGRTTENPSSG